MTDEEFVSGFDPGKTIVVIVDMQNDFCSIDGYYDRHERLDPDQRNQLIIPSAPRKFEPRNHIKEIIGPTIRIIHLALKKVEIIFIQADYGPLHGRTKCPLFADHPERFPCRHNSWGQQLIKPLKRLQGKYCLPTYCKNCHSAFANPRFAGHLNRKGAENLIMIGVETDCCIRATTEDGIAQDLKIAIPQDCTATASGTKSKCRTLKSLAQSALVAITSSKVIIAWLTHI